MRLAPFYATLFFFSPVFAGEPVNQAPIVLDAVTITATRERVEAYKKATKDLFEQARTQHVIRYIDILQKVYDTSKFNLDQVLTEKKVYRETIAKDRPFLSRYDLVYNEIHFDGKVLDSLPAYVEQAPHYVLVSIGGIVLTTKASPEMCKRADRAFPYAHFGGVDPQVKFECMMQNINRFYALYKGHPVMTPIETVEALSMLGFRWKASYYKKVFNKAGIAVSDDDLNRAISAKSIERGRDAFGVAYVVTKDLENLRFSSSTNAAQLMLRNLTLLLLETPGHI